MILDGIVAEQGIDMVQPRTCTAESGGLAGCAMAVSSVACVISTSSDGFTCPRPSAVLAGSKKPPRTTNESACNRYSTSLPAWQ